MPDTTPLIVPVDGTLARALDLDGQLGFHCPLLEEPGPVRTGTVRETGTRYRDLAPVLENPRAGVLATVAGGRTLAYAVFGPPAVFRNASALPFALDENALLIAALHAIPEARAENSDVDLLIAVIRFAAGHGFEQVQAVCRDDPDAGPEPRTTIISASGFAVSEPVGGLRLGTLSVSGWGRTSGSEQERE